MAVLNQAKAVAIDANLSEDALRYAADNVTSPLFVDTVSVTKAKKLKSILGSIHTLKPNRLEAECLTGIAITDEESLRQAAKKLLDCGVQHVLITLGADGALLADKDGLRHVAAVPAGVRNATGAGDAMMAALIYAYMKDMTMDESAAFASAAAAIATESEDTMSEALSEDLILARLD